MTVVMICDIIGYILIAAVFGWFLAIIVTNCYREPESGTDDDECW